MRRIVLSLAVLSALTLGACSGGGSVLNIGGNTTVDRVIITTVGPSNVARVLPGAAIPLSATAVRGGQNGVVNANQFIWSALLVTSGTYPINELGGTKACATVTATIGGTATPYTADFSIYITIDPTNESNVLFVPPTTIPVPTGATAISVPTNAAYCVVVSATPRGGSAANTGSITVAVVPPGFPEL
jgi:hypothetical protein